MKYEKPIAEVVAFDNSDVVTESGGILTCGTQAAMDVAASCSSPSVNSIKDYCGWILVDDATPNGCSSYMF